MATQGSKLKRRKNPQTKSTTQKKSVKPTSLKQCKSSRTDFTIPIYPQYITAILEGSKTHEYRKYKLPATNMWIYETAPISAIRYYAVISSAQTPDEMSEGFSNIERNGIFKEGLSTAVSDESGKPSTTTTTATTTATVTWYAHEILELYRLKMPVSIQRLKEKGWLRSHPQGLCWVPDEMKTTLMRDMVKVK